jgi:hypothetical protein
MRVFYVSIARICNKNLVLNNLKMFSVTRHEVDEMGLSRNFLDKIILYTVIKADNPEPAKM